MKTFDPQTTLELEAAAFRRLVDHLRSRPDVQNIDMMNLAGFCRNCLSGWIADAAKDKGLELSKDESREIVTACRIRSGRRATRKKRTPSSRPHSRKAARAATKTNRSAASATSRHPHEISLGDCSATRLAARRLGR